MKMRKLLFGISLLMSGMMFMTSCDFENFFGDNKVPPTSITYSIYPALSRYLGMSEERVIKEMLKLQGLTMRREGYDLIFTKEGDFGYVMTVRGEVISVVFTKYYPDRRRAVEDLIFCSDAMFRVGTSASDYLGKFNGRRFVDPNQFLDYLNINKNRLSDFVASEARAVYLDGVSVDTGWETNIFPSDGDISVMIKYLY